MNRILVTGASGFVGKYLVAALRDSGSQVIPTVRASSQAAANDASAGVQFDLQQPHDLRAEQLHGIDVIYHLAARVHVMRAPKEMESQFELENAAATAVLAQTAAKAGVRRFVFVSSIKVNGERTLERPFTRDDVPAPQDGYARSKLNAERAVLEVAARSSLEAVIVRPPLIYGPGVGANFRRMMALVERGWPLPFGAIRNVRSLVSVWNLVDFLVHCARSPAAGKVWLVSDGQDVSTPRLLELVAEGLGKRARLLPVPVAMLRALGSMTGQRAQLDRLTESLQVDISHTREQLGWQPPLDSQEAIRRTAAWFRKEHHAG